MKKIYEVYVGSKAHGLFMSNEEFGEEATCDIDIMYFYKEPLDFYLGLKSLLPLNKLTNTEVKGEFDIVGHEIRKTVDLLMKGNPNMLVSLYGDEESIITMTPEGQMLRDNRFLFLSADNLYYRFKNYAQDQMYKIERGVYQGYMGAKRKELADKFGYDTKNAMTLIRLLNESIEALNTGTITVDKRKNGTRDYYIDIKRGKWTLEEVKKESAKLSHEAEIAYKETLLPKEPDREKIDKLLYEILTFGNTIT